MDRREALEITELIWLMIQLYFEAIVDAVSALPFTSVIDTYNGCCESHFVFDDEDVISAEYFDSSSRNNSTNDVREGEGELKRKDSLLYTLSQNYFDFDMKSFSKNVYVDDLFFGIIE